MIKVIRLTILAVSLAFASYASAEAPVINGYDPDNNSQLSEVVVTDQADSSTHNTTVAHATPAAKTALPITQRVIILERQVNNLTQLLSQVNQLQSQIQDLRGEVEIQKHTIKVLQDQVRSQYQDLDQRLTVQSKNAVTKVISAKPADNTKTVGNDTATDKPDNSNDIDKKVTKSPAVNKQQVNQSVTVTVPAPPAVADVKDNDQKAYTAAVDLLKTKKYSQAATAFQKYIKQYPNGQQTNNARFWLGQLYLLQGQPDQALEQFHVVLKKDPNNKKTPDILLQVGLAYYAKGDMTHAQAAFKRVVQKYPNTTAAKLAQTRLKLTQQAHVDQTASGTGTDSTPSNT